MANDQCGQHAVLFDGLRTQLAQLRDAVESGMAANADRLDRVLARQEAAVVEMTRIAGEVSAMQSRVEGLGLENRDQWGAINGLRRLVLIGLGVVLTITFLAPLIVRLVK